MPKWEIDARWNSQGGFRGRKNNLSKAEFDRIVKRALNQGGIVEIDAHMTYFD